MMQTRMALFNRPALDYQRVEALTAVGDVSSIPEPLVYYLRALEMALLHELAEHKFRLARESGWTYREPTHTSKEPGHE